MDQSVGLGESMNNMPQLMPSLVLAGLFVVLSNRQTYEMVSGLVAAVLPDVELVDDEGHPTVLGQALHGVVLVVVVHLVNGFLDDKILH
tara:strand:+ start:1133 stop:1399 length:267 start_codon:yes stop_codon:yes gene_type:complete